MPTPNYTRSKGEKKPETYARLYRALGLDLDDSDTGEVAVECPQCGKPKLYVNCDDGTYHCKTCEFSGNHFTFVRWYYGECLAATTPRHYRDLGKRRGIGWQTLKRHGLAYDRDEKQWLIPFHNRDGNVVNVQRYKPDLKGNNKFNLPCLTTGLFGLDGLSDDDRLVFLCEGPFDALALDHHLKQNRHKYDILALPGSNYRTLEKHLAGRKVRTMFDNDDGGDSHRRSVEKVLGNRVADELSQLVWPAEYEKGTDLNDLLRAEPGLKVIGWSKQHARKSITERRLKGWRTAAEIRRSEAYQKKKEWIWTDHVPCRTVTVHGPV